MPDFQYQPPTGPLSGSEFERQTTRFFQQVQGAADAAQSAASAAQVTANEALERAQAPNLVDGKTTQADASGKITVKDVAIGGDASDLASARGFFYDKYVPWYAGTPADTYLITDFNEFKKPGRYHIRWREGTDAEGGVVTQNNPNAGNGGSYWYDGIMEVDPISSCSYVSSYSRLIQRLIVATIYNSQACRIFIRRYINNTSTGGYWEPWKTFTFDSDFGDGLRITNYKISVPEMEGATASANGVSGLVPPPLKADLGKSLGANGEWTYPADVAVGGDVNDLASARGFFYDKYVPWYAGTPADTYLITDFNEFKKPGRYHIRWREGTDAEGGVVTQNNPNAGNGGSYWYDGIMEVDPISSCSYVSSYSRLIQRLIVATIYNSQACRIFIRRYINNTSTGGYWEPWKTFTFDSDFGDGLRITNYKISVPEMEGATASANGVSGLVPPPLKADLGKSLGANGEWTYPADVAVGGDVNDLASMRGQIGHARELGDNVDYNTVVEAGFYLINANGSVNAPFAGNAFFLQVFRSKKDTLNKNFYQIAYNYSSARERTFIRQYRTASKDWSPWSEILMSSNTGDGITVNNGIISVPEYEGATTSAAGISGLVPPAAAGQADYVLCGDGEWRDIKTLVAAAQARLADEKIS